MIKVILFLIILTTNSYAVIFRLPPENPVPEKFDQFIFDNSLKTIIMTNLKMLKRTNERICATTDCKFLLKSPNTLEIHMNGEIIKIDLEIKD